MVALKGKPRKRRAEIPTLPFPDAACVPWKWQMPDSSRAPVARVALRTLKVHITTGTTEALLKVDFERSKLEDPWH